MNEARIDRIREYTTNSSNRSDFFAEFSVIRQYHEKIFSPKIFLMVV